MDVRRMYRIFGEIYSRVSSHPYTDYLAQSKLPDKFRVKLDNQEYVTFEDVDEYLRIKFKYALPQVATVYKDDLSDNIEKAYTLWLDFRKEIDQALKEKGLTWSDVEAAVSLFSKSLDEITDLLLKREEAAKCLVIPRAEFDLYSIPLTLGVIAPSADRENAQRYLEESEKALHLIALAHLRRLGEEGKDNSRTLARIRIIKEAIDHVKSKMMR